MKLKNQPFKYSSLFSFNKQVKNEKRKKKNDNNINTYSLLIPTKKETPP